MQKIVLNDIFKEKYRVHCANEPTIPFFSQAWWLDAICGEHWGVCLVEKGGVLVASLPFYYEYKWGFLLLRQPPLTQTLGPWLKKFDGKYSNKLAYEKDCLDALIAQLPRFDLFQQNFHRSIINWLPFYWRGYCQTTRYSYRFPSLDNLDLIWSGLRENIRGDIKKASKRYELKIRDNPTVDELYSLIKKTFLRQGLKVPYTLDFVRHLDHLCALRNARKIFIVEDQFGNFHAGVYLVWDESCAYYLMGGGDPDNRSSGATSLCMWEAIKFAATVSKEFDFEGSMIESVERFFRAFGSIQTPYFSLSKSQSMVINWGLFVRDKWERIRHKSKGKNFCVK